MAQEDKFKKQVDQLGRVLAKLLANSLGLKSAEEITANIRQAHNELESNHNFNLNQFVVADIETFLALVKTSDLSSEHKTIMADIFYEFAEKTKNKQEQHTTYEKALVLYEDVSRNSRNYSIEHHTRIEKIKKIMGVV